MLNEQTSYYAFISYNSADEKWAKWLQHNLEYYHIPSALCKEYPELPKKIRPVFWYKQDLSGTKLKKALNNELSSSKYLIVICSPDSAKSAWVNDEVVAFIGQGKGDKIIPFIVAGTPHANNPEEECFPPALRNLTREEEIRGIDVRRKEGKYHALVDVIATMFDVRFDALWQRHKRRRTMIYSIWMGVILVLCSIAGICYMRMCPQLEYYTDFAECNGYPKGINALTELEVKNRYISYKFVYKRKHLFDNKKKLMFVERINAYGFPIDNIPDLSYLWSQGQLKNALLPIIELNENGVLFYDKSRNLRERWDYTIMNTHDATVLIVDVKRVDILNSNNFIFERQERANVNRYCYELNEDGYCTRITYHSSSNVNLNESNCANNNGAYGYILSRDTANRIETISVLDYNGNRMEDSENVHSIKYSYSKDGNLSSIKTYDLNGRATVNKQLGYLHCITYFHDQYGNTIESVCLDTNMNVCNNEFGYAIQKVKYNNGCPIEIVNFDQTGLRTNDAQVKCSRTSYTNNTQGKTIRAKCYDVDDNLCLGYDGYAIVEFEYDSKGNLIEESYYDENYQPTLNKTSGYSKVIREYNAINLVTNSYCYGINNEKVINKGGFFQCTSKYNSLGQPSEMRTYDTIGNLTTNKEGYAIRRCAVFNDRFGNTIHEITSYGKTEEPVYDKNIRAHKWTYTFNAQGQLIQEEYYNTSNKLINNWLGYSKAIYTYDSKGRLVTRSFYDSNGKNTSVMNRIDYSKLNGKNIIGGYAKDSIAYISNNKQMRFLFNSTGEIDDCDFCSAIELREQRGDTLIRINYDRNYNKTSKYGWAISVAIFDDRNFPIDVLYFNEDSIRMPYGNTGVSRMKNIFDGKGNRIECRSYDCADNLFSADGAPILCFEYDERNNEIKRYTKDNFEKPYNRDNYGFGIRQIYDKLDRVKEAITIDTIGRPYMLPNLQYAIRKLKYDNFGNVIEESYYDEYDIPTHCAQGYHKVKMLYDDYQNRTGFGYFDTIGNAISINGSHCQTNLYNNYQLSESSYFDEDSSYVGKIQYV